MQTITIENKTEVPLQRIADLITGALEGGSNYWYMIEDKIEPTEWLFEAHPSLWVETKIKNPNFHYTGDIPLNPNGALIITDMEYPLRPAKRLDLEACQRGLALLASKYPRQWAEFMSEDEDGDTCDAFLQCALLGEVIYG